MTKAVQRGPTRIAVGLTWLACLGAAPAWADPQDARIQALESKLERSLKLIEQLSSRIAELERAGRAPEPAATRAAAASTPRDDDQRAIAGLQAEVDQLTEGLSKRRFDVGLPIHGFADVQAGASSATDPRRLHGFNAGTLDLYLTPDLGDRIRSLVEVAFEYKPDGSSAVDVERLQLGYTVSNALTLWMGRFHTPFGLWNTAFHHGANLQTSIFRPRFIEFEDKGGIVPTHSVGLWGTGQAELGPGKITYDLYVSNGPTIRGREQDFNPFTDDNASKLFGFNLGYKPTQMLRGLTLGLHGFEATVRSVTSSEVSFGRTRVRMAGAYAGYDANDWEVFAEYYGFADANRDPTSGPLHSHAWFVHVGKAFGRLTPYARYERASLDSRDIYFASQALGRSYNRAVLGSRYAIDARSSVKFEWSRSAEAGLLQLDENGLGVYAPATRYNRAAFQYSIAF